MVIALTADQLQLERGSATQSSKATFSLTGTPATNQVSGGGLQTSTARWHGAQLVIEGARTLPNGEIGTVKEVLELGPDKQSLTIERTIGTGTSEFKTREVFVKSGG